MKKKNLVIIGGGFSGTTLAASLEKKLPPEWEIYLLSKTNFVTYNPLLPEVVGASVLPAHVEAPIRYMIKRTRLRMVTVDNIDFEKRIVHYHNNEQGQLHFDQIVFASGVQANMTMMEGLKDYALPLKTVGDALFIRNEMIDCLERATIHADPDKRRALTSFVVIGGGFSGVEVAGEMDNFLKTAEKYYKNVKLEDCQVTLLHGQDCLLPEISPKLGRKTEKIFRNRGIDVRLNARAERIENGKVILSDGTEVRGSVIVCTIGTQPQAVSQHDDLPSDRGKIVTLADMSVEGVDGVWALGDCALVPNAYNDRLCPPTAQFADRQAKFLAKNITAKLMGSATKPFNYKPAGMLAAIGHNSAVAEIYGVRLSGLLAFMLWRGTYLLKMPTLARKARLFLEWNWSLVFQPDIAHLGFKRTGED